MNSNNRRETDANPAKRISLIKKVHVTSDDERDS